MRIGKQPRLALIFIAVSHGLVALAGFFAPYDYSEQNRELPYAPPPRSHFIDSQHRFHLRPFVYQSIADEQSAGGYRENRASIYPIQLFARGAEYTLFGGLTSRVHLFGTPGPGRIFLIGSDAYGRDQFSRFLYGGRISLFAGIFATSVSLILGLALGGLAGFYGRWIDELIMRIAEIFLALPWLYFLFAARAFLPLAITPNAIFLLLIAIIGVIGWARPARLIRGIVLSAKERDYVLAAKGFGASNIYLLRRHILPQTFGIVCAQAAVLIPKYILAEVVLSLFGRGVNEPAPSWGNLLANLRQYDVIESYWWMLLPALALIPILFAYYSLFSYCGYYNGGTLMGSERTATATDRF
jgi:peptide/nickel transport system permease protein